MIPVMHGRTPGDLLTVKWDGPPNLQGGQLHSAALCRPKSSDTSALRPPWPVRRWIWHLKIEKTKIRFSLNFAKRTIGGIGIYGISHVHAQGGIRRVSSHEFMVISPPRWPANDGEYALIL